MYPSCNFPDGSFLHNYNVRTKKLTLATIYRLYSDFTGFTCTRVCFYAITSQVDLWNHHYCQNWNKKVTELFHFSDPLCYTTPLWSHTFPPFTLSSHPYPWQPMTCSPYLEFVILRMLYKWNYTQCNLLRWAFFTQHNSLEIHSNCCIY